MKPDTMKRATRKGEPQSVCGTDASISLLLSLHGSGQIDQPTVREQIVHEIQNTFEGKVIWGEDLMRLTLADARMSTIESRQD